MQNHVQNPCSTNSSAEALAECVRAAGIKQRWRCLMSISAATSAASASNSVGAPSETRIWNLFTCITDESGEVLQKHNRKFRSCCACGEEGQYYALDKAIKHLEDCEEANQQHEHLPQLLDEVRVDRLQKRNKAQTKVGKSNLGKHPRSTDSGGQSTLDSRLLPVKIPAADQSAIEMALLMLFIMGNVAFNVADSPWYKRVFRFLRPGFVPPSMCWCSVPKVGMWQNLVKQA